MPEVQPSSVGRGHVLPTGANPHPLSLSVAWETGTETARLRVPGEKQMLL